MNPQIRQLKPEDWPDVLAIYLEGVATGQATFETEAPSWTIWDAAHLPFARLLAAYEGQACGWAALSPVSKRAAYAGVAEVSVYVSSEWRGKGIGKVLLTELINESERNGIWTLQASVFPENAASVTLHLGCGFREVGTRRSIGQLNGIWRDTLLLERRSELI